MKKYHVTLKETVVNEYEVYVMATSKTSAIEQAEEMVNDNQEAFCTDSESDGIEVESVESEE